MKLIHCADIHLGSKIEGYPKETADTRKMEVRTTFLRMVNYAKEQGVSAILLAGDVFDREKPYKKDSEFFYDVVSSNPEIDFLYLRGNHDEEGERRELNNLKTFTTEWSAYRYENIVISGIELVKENRRAYYSTLNLEEADCNIVMLHGQIGEQINLVKLRDKHIDYLALGHIHTRAEGRIDERGRYAYSGCLEGRGFDETGVKGFMLLDTESRDFAQFIPFSKREIHGEQVDVSGLLEGYAMKNRVLSQVKFKAEDIYRIELIGEVDAEADEFAADAQSYLEREEVCAFLRVKDCTKKKIDYAAYEGDKSLKGEFVRAVSACGEYSEEEKAQIIAYGLKALAGREVDA